MVPPTETHPKHRHIWLACAAILAVTLAPMPADARPGQGGGNGGGGGAPAAPPACSDGKDNDFDRLADYPLDPGCADPAGASEGSAVPRECLATPFYRFGTLCLPGPECWDMAPCMQSINRYAAWAQQEAAQDADATTARVRDLAGEQLFENACSRLGVCL